MIAMCRLSEVVADGVDVGPMEEEEAMADKQTKSLLEPMDKHQNNTVGRAVVEEAEVAENYHQILDYNAKAFPIIKGY